MIHEKRGALAQILYGTVDGGIQKKLNAMAKQAEETKNLDNNNKCNFCLYTTAKLLWASKDGIMAIAEVSNYMDCFNKKFNQQIEACKDEIQKEKGKQQEEQQKQEKYQQQHNSLMGNIPTVDQQEIVEQVIEETDNYDSERQNKPQFDEPPEPNTLVRALKGPMTEQLMGTMKAKITRPLERYALNKITDQWFQTINEKNLEIQRGIMAEAQVRYAIREQQPKKYHKTLNTEAKRFIEGLENGEPQGEIAIRVVNELLQLPIAILGEDQKVKMRCPGKGKPIYLQFQGHKEGGILRR